MFNAVLTFLTMFIGAVAFFAGTFGFGILVSAEDDGWKGPLALGMVLTLATAALSMTLGGGLHTGMDVFVIELACELIMGSASWLFL